MTGLPSQLGLLRVEVPDSLVLRQIEHDWHPFPWVRMGVLLLVGGFVFLVGLLHFFRRVIGPLLARRGELVIGLLGLFGAWVAAAWLLWSCERHVEASYATFPGAMVSTFLGLLPGDDGPVTASGQHYWTWCRGIAGFLFGGIVITWFRQGVGQGIQIAKDWLLGLGQPLRARGHAIILNNLPKKTEGLIRELQANPSADGQSIVIVAQGPMDRTLPSYRDVRFVQGDPASEKCLRQAQIKKARSINLLSAWINPDPGDRRKFLRGDQADARTIVTLHAIRSICGKSCRFKKFVTELKLRKNIPAAQDAAGMPMRIICDDDSGSAAA